MQIDSAENLDAKAVGVSTDQGWGSLNNGADTAQIAVALKDADSSREAEVTVVPLDFDLPTLSLLTAATPEITRFVLRVAPPRADTLSLALVSGETLLTTANLVLFAVLPSSYGISVSFFDEDAVTASNLSSMDVILCQRTGLDKTTLLGYLEDYMSVDGIPLVIGRGEDSGVQSTNLSTLLGITGVVNEQTANSFAFDDQRFSNDMARGWSRGTVPSIFAGSGEHQFVAGDGQHAGNKVVVDGNGKTVMCMAEAGASRVSEGSGTFPVNVVWGGFFGSTEDMSGDGLNLLVRSLHWVRGRYNNLVFPT
jgi:hypothetical protein